MHVDLRMSGYSVVGSVVKLPADQLQPGGDRNDPWRKRRKIALTEPKRKDGRQKKRFVQSDDASDASVDGATAAADGTAGNAIEADLSALKPDVGVAYLHGCCRLVMPCCLGRRFIDPCEMLAAARPSVTRLGSRPGATRMPIASLEQGACLGNVVSPHPFPPIGLSIDCLMVSPCQEQAC